MKISRLQVDDFSAEDCPKINRDNIAGDDMVFFGGNRSGKTLTFNAILYSLYGRDATFDVSPGWGADTTIYLDTGDFIERSDSHIYHHEGEDLEGDAVNDYIGSEDITKLQFLHSNVNQQPLSKLSGDELLNVIRSTLSSGTQDRIQYNTQALDYLNHRIEMVKRGRGEKPSISNLESERDEINLNEMEDRLEKIEHLWSLIESGEIISIRDRLQRDDEVSKKLKNLTKERRRLRDELRQTQRRLREARRYTDKINDIIIDAMEELPCPICDSLVTESTSEARLKRGDCPHCGQSRSISDLKSNLREQIDEADEVIEPLEEEVKELNEEISEIDDEIDELREEDPDLEEVDPLVERALDSADYDIDTAKTDTREWLEEYKSNIEEDKKRLQTLNERIENRKSEISKLKESVEAAEDSLSELAEASFEEEIELFQELWSENYQRLAPELSAEVEINREGEIRVPGTEPGETRTFDRLCSGEQRLMNISFAFTLAQLADEDSNENNLQTIVMDEPLTNVEQDIQESVVSSLRDSDVQCILTTSNSRIQSLFNPRNVKDFSRIDLDTATLSQYT